MTATVAVVHCNLFETGRPMIHLHVNGETHELPESVSIKELLDAVDVPANYLAVEVNEEVVPREKHGSVLVNDGDRIEVVTLVGGG